MTTDILEIDKRFRFRRFRVYQDARKFVQELKNFAKKRFPKEEQYGLQSQLWRALDSVILNMAEGSDRSTDKDFAHFLNSAHTSLNEVVACLDIALDNSYITAQDNVMYIKKSADLVGQLTAFRKSLLRSPTK